ncbi:hypothetical protein OIU76_030486 [Salix suchowensis]|nr:hypothetical protein OIU76_030486 [Salix suchowensis]
MALLLSTTCISKSVTQTNPKTHFKSSPFSLTKTFSAKLPTKRARKISPLHVAAPPSQSQPSVRKEEEGFGVDDESGEEVSDSKFTWRDHWYPVSLLEDLDPLLPTPFQLLGRDFGSLLVQSSLQELVLPDFLQWCPKVCSLFGQTRMVGKELKPPNPPCYLMTSINLSSQR